MILNGVWVGWGLGDNSKTDMTVKNAKAYMRKMYASYAGGLADTNLFDQAMQDAVKTMQGRLAASGKLVPGGFILGVLDLPTEYAMGFKKKALPWYVSVEGHSSNMFIGPVADTGTQLQGEGRVYHQPTGYDNGAIPFDNNDGVNALAANVANCPVDVDLYIGGYSQGMIVVFDYLNKYGIPVNLKGVLMYGNPCRKLNKCAQWALAWITKTDTHGLDPLKRFGLPGCVDLDAAGIPNEDVYREGDIFAENGDDKTSEIKAAVYQAIARGDIFSNPYSIAAEIADLFSVPVEEVIGIVMAIVSGIEFLATSTNPHYAPYDITGGVNWLRNLLIKNAA